MNINQFSLKLLLVFMHNGTIVFYQDQIFLLSHLLKEIFFINHLVCYHYHKHSNYF